MRETKDVYREEIGIHLLTCFQPHGLEGLSAKSNEIPSGRNGGPRFTEPNFREGKCGVYSKG